MFIYIYIKFDNFALIFQSLSTVKSELPALYLIYIYILGLLESSVRFWNETKYKFL